MEREDIAGESRLASASGRDVRTAANMQVAPLETGAIFSRLVKRRVRHPVVAVAAARDLIVVATAASTLIRWRCPGSSAEVTSSSSSVGQREISVPRGRWSRAKEPVRRVFVDPSGSHVVLSLDDGSCFYVHDSSDVWVAFQSETPLYPNCMVWDRFGSRRRFDSGPVLLGAQDGTVLQMRFGRGILSAKLGRRSSAFEVERPYRVARLDGVIIRGMCVAKLVCARNVPPRYVVLIATMTTRVSNVPASVRLYQYVGGHSSLLDGPNYAALFNYYDENSITECVDLPLPPNMRTGLIDCPFRCSLAFRAGEWALTTGLGVLCGALSVVEGSKLPNPGEKATSRHKMIPYDASKTRANELPLSLHLLGRKCALVLWSDRLQLVDFDSGHVRCERTLTERGSSRPIVDSGILDVYFDSPTVRPADVCDNEAIMKHAWLSTETGICRVTARLPPLSIVSNIVVEAKTKKARSLPEEERAWCGLLDAAALAGTLEDDATLAKIESACVESHATFPRRSLAGFCVVRRARAELHAKLGNIEAAATMRALASRAACHSELGDADARDVSYAGDAIVRSSLESYLLSALRRSVRGKAIVDDATTTLVLTRDATDASFGVTFSDDLAIMSASGRSERLFGVRKGQRVLAVNGDPVATLKQLQVALSGKRTVAMLISRSPHFKVDDSRKVLSDALASFVELTLFRSRSECRRRSFDGRSASPSMQRTLLATWLLELRLGALDAVHDAASAERAALDLAAVVSEHASDLDSGTSIHLLSDSLICLTSLESSECVFPVKLSHVLSPLLALAEGLSDDVMYRVACLLIFLRQADELARWFVRMGKQLAQRCERRRRVEILAYRTATAFFNLDPAVAVRTWTALLSHLDPVRLLPSIVRRAYRSSRGVDGERKQVPPPLAFLEAVRFLNACMTAYRTDATSGSERSDVTNASIPSNSRLRRRLSSTDTVVSAALAMRGRNASVVHQCLVQMYCHGARYFSPNVFSSKLVKNLNEWSGRGGSQRQLLSGLSLPWVLRQCRLAEQWQAAAFAASAMGLNVQAVECALRVSARLAITYARKFAMSKSRSSGEISAHKAMWDTIVREISDSSSSSGGTKCSIPVDEDPWADDDEDDGDDDDTTAPETTESTSSSSRSTSPDRSARRKVVEEKIDMLLSLVKEVDLLQIGDVLDSIPDTVQIDKLREVLQLALESSIDKINALRSEVTALSIEAMTVETICCDLKQKCLEVLPAVASAEDGASPNSCKRPVCALTEEEVRPGDDVLTFARPFPHIVRASAAMRFLSNQLSFNERSRIAAVSSALRAARVASEDASALTRPLKRQLLRLVSTRSPLGSDLMIDSVFQPFIAASEVGAKKAWSYDLL
eukprot:g1630.t1